MEIVVAAVVGYLLGSIPVGLIAGRLAGGVDVRDYGSGKTGFTNSLRVLGLRRSLPVFLGDFGKGLAAALLPFIWSDDPWARAIGGLAAVRSRLAAVRRLSRRPRRPHGRRRAQRPQPISRPDRPADRRR